MADTHILKVQIELYQEIKRNRSIDPPTSKEGRRERLHGTKWSLLETPSQHPH